MNKKKLEAAIKRQQELTTLARSQNRDLTEDEQKDFDAQQVIIDECKSAEPTADPTAPSAADNTNTADAVKQALADERKRSNEITTLCRQFNMEPGAYIEGGNTIEEVRAAILDNLVKTGNPLHVNVKVTEDGADKFRAAAADGLFLRTGGSIEKPATGADEFRSMSLRDIAIECFVRDGKNPSEMLRMSKDQMYGELSRQFFNPVATFPAILDETIRKSIVQAYQLVPTTFQAWTSKGSVSDFKPTADHQYLLGGVGDFEKVPENGELKNSTPETKLLPQRKIDTYGKQFSMSRQAFIDDDIGFLSAVPAAYTQAAKKTIDKACYKILLNNPVIFDGVELFHTNHKNLVATGAAPSQETVQNIILLAQGQTDPFGDPIYEVPKYLIVPVGYEFKLAVLFKSAQVTGSSNNDINPLYNYPLTVIQSPWINSMSGTAAKPWYMLTDPASSKALQVDYLNGNETPTFRRSEVPGTLGFVWDIWHDWGITAVDYRGIYKNPGVV